MAIVIHGKIAQTRGYYSKIFNRTLVDGQRGAQTCAVWEQTLPVGGYIAPHYHDYEETGKTISNLPYSLLPPLPLCEQRVGEWQAEGAKTA